MSCKKCLRGGINYISEWYGTAGERAQPKLAAQLSANLVMEINQMIKPKKEERRSGKVCPQALDPAAAVLYSSPQSSS